MTRRHSISSAAFGFFLFTVVVRPVEAQDDEAKALHMAGKSAMEEADKLERKGQHAAAQGVYAEACLKFKQALALSPKRPTTGMALALCHAAVGKPATALAEFRSAKEWAEAQSKAGGSAGAANAQVAAASEVEIKKLESIVPRLRIKVPANIRKLPGLTIDENGNDVPEEKWDTDILVDPGTRTISVSASGKKDWSVQEEVVQGKVTEVLVTPDWKVEQPAPRLSGPRVVGFVGIGLGGAAMVAGGVFGIVAISKNDASNKDGHCDATSACDEEGTQLRLDARSVGNASTIAFAVGGAFALTGIVLVALNPARPKDAEPRVRASLHVGPGAIEVRGRW